MAKQDKTSRQAKIDEIRNSSKSADRRRGGMIIGVAVALGLLIIFAAAWKPVTDWWDGREFDNLDLAAIGADAKACQEVTTKPANGMQDHVPQGSPLDYPEAPPAFGPHYDSWEPIERKFYSQDRPELGYLVHNLEHGYTILWYDETAAEDDDAMATLKGLARKFDSDNFRNKFKIAPWTSEDGDAFPEGQHVAMTHWSVGGAGQEDTTQQVGVWQYCSEPSGEALEKFMKDYPYMDSPEPNAG